MQRASPRFRPGQEFGGAWGRTRSFEEIHAFTQ